MRLENTSLATIEDIVRTCLKNLYNEPGELFSRNKGRGLSERCLVFRFAYYL